MLINIKDKPIQVISIKAETSNNDSLCWGFNVEITLKCNHAKELYIHLNQYLNSHYTVSDRSMFDFVTGRTDELEQVNFIEEYDSLEETKISKFYEYFNLAQNIAHDLISCD
ncbi:hypothetical protein [uncultured Catenibacterium sp.]|uniref:hypothetical protein n=1 Tax=uncultured Catenibacterium sp. TaxID=286142 RepID=UPI0025E24484|nr:hypothetical protein [uncultured Catenibacterium sp.]